MNYCQGPRRKGGGLRLTFADRPDQENSRRRLKYPKQSRLLAVSSILFVTLIFLVASHATAQEIQVLEHDTQFGAQNSLVQVDADTYALAYTGPDDDGFIKTFTISADGMTITQVQSLEHDTTSVISNSLVQVDADTYALAYAGFDQDGFIKTFTISSDGTTITEEQSLEHDTSRGVGNSLVQVDADTYALAYEGNNNRGWIATFTISSDGTSITEEQSLQHETTLGSQNSLVQVDADTYALAYRGTDQDGFIRTFTISADGTSITQVQTLEHETDSATNNSLVQVDANTYALAYTGPDTDGFIKTFTISANGSSISQVQSLEHEASFGNNNSLVQVDANTYALAYAGPGLNGDGFIATFTISADGTTLTEVESLEHDTGKAHGNSLIQVDADTYVVAYSGGGDDGFIKTFSISNTGGLPVKLMSFSVD